MDINDETDINTGPLTQNDTCPSPLDENEAIYLMSSGEKL